MYKNYFKKISLKKTKSGFAMLFAVMIASFLITLGISIFSISLKEIQMATAARDSQIAYYAADSARECALYWDVKQGIFPPCFDDAGNIKSCTGSELTPALTCNGVPTTMTFNNVAEGSKYYKSDKEINFFQASSTSSSTPVADIIIEKTFDDVNNKIITTISAFGHNTSILGRRVERGIQTTNNN